MSDQAVLFVAVFKSLMFVKSFLDRLGCFTNVFFIKIKALDRVNASIRFHVGLVILID